MKKVAIFYGDSNGCFPVPASKGGAVSTLIEHLIGSYKKNSNFSLTIFSYYDSKAYSLSKQYPLVTFKWIRVPMVIRLLDKLLYNLAVFLFPKKKTISFRSIFSLIYMIFKDSYYLRTGHFDKIVIENNIPLAWIVKLSKFKGDIYYHFHNVPRISGGCRSVFARCKAIFCVSKYVADNVCSEKSAIGLIPRSKALVYYNCIDTNFFCPTPSDKNVKDRFGIKSCDKVIIFVGRLSEEKGIDQLLKAIPYIVTQNIKIVIVGSLMFEENGPKDKYQQFIVEFTKQYPQKIIFTGYIPQYELPQVYAIADVAVLPSMWDEPAGLTMIEALSCQVPLITTKSGGIPEYVGNDAFVLDRDVSLPRKIAKAIDYILSNPKKFQSKSQLARQHVVEKFGLNLYYNRFLELLSVD